MVYQLFAMVADPRLPADLQGAGTPELSEPDLLQIADHLDQLPADLKADAEPFFIAPSDPSSYWYQLNSGAAATEKLALAGGGSFPQTQGALSSGSAAASGPVYVPLGSTQHVKVWYVPTYGAQNQHVAQVVLDNAETIWSAEAKLMSPMDLTPVSDGDLTIPNGGDGLLDVYIGHMTVAQTNQEKGTFIQAQTLPYPGFESGPRPSFIQLSDQIFETQTLSGKVVSRDAVVRDVLAHEMFHAFQDAIPGTRYEVPNSWWWEASSTWIEDYVFPTDDNEQTYLSDWNNDPGPPPLNWHDPLVDELNGINWVTPPYDNYIWPFFLVQRSGDPQIVEDLWQMVGSGIDILDAMQNLPGIGDFRTAFREYALWTYNEPNTPSDQFRDHGAPLAPFSHQVGDDHRVDGIDPNDPKTHGLVSLPVISKTLSLRPLTMTYFVIQNPGPGAHQLRIDWSGVTPAHVDVQAMTQLSGERTYQPIRDWSDRSSYTFCLDKPEEKVHEVVLIMDNPDERQPAGGDVQVAALSAPCGSASGFFSFTHSVSGSESYSLPGVKDTVNGTYSSLETIAGDLQITPQDLSDPLDLVYTINGSYEFHDGGVAAYSESVRDKTVSGNGALKISMDGQGTSHDPPLPGDPAYDNAIAGGSTPDQIAQMTGTLNIYYDTSDGTATYDLGINPTTTFTPTYDYQSNTTGHFLIWSGTCSRSFSNGSGVLSQSGGCGAKQQDLGTITDTLGVPLDLLGKATVDPKSGTLDASVQTSNTDCGPSSGSLRVDWVPNDDIDPPIGDGPQSCTESSTFSLHIEVPPFAQP